MRDTPDPRRRPRIWIVDDSSTENAITRRALGDSYDVEAFDDGSVVVERLVRTSDRPDLLLCDWVMPGMAGDEVCRFLRSNAATADLPVIIVTASRVETHDIVAGLAAGANDYVPRPFAPQELRARVDAALRAKALNDSYLRERRRLDAVNRLTTSLVRAGSSVDAIVEKLAEALVASLCDGCSVMLLPGPFAAASVARHRRDPTGAAMAEIGALADPAVHEFENTAQAREMLSPQYRAYIDRFGLRGLAIMPFPTRVPLQGVVTLTRDAASEPFDPEDLVAIETAVEYAALAIETGLRHDAERVGRAQLNAVLSNLPVAIIATDDRGAVRLINGAAVELVPGIEHAGHISEIYALATWAAADGSPVPESEWILGRALTSHLASRAEMLVTPRSEPARLLSVSGVPLLDAHNKISGSVAVLQDVSAERAIEAERERIAKFQQEMLAIVGHDLRSPLGAIAVATDLLHERTSEVAGAEALLRKIATSTNRMSTMVDQLLDMTRATLGSGIRIEPSDVKLHALIQGVVDELALAHPRMTFTVVAGEPIAGRWDAARLEQVIANLLSNAAQYGHPEGPVTIEVKPQGDMVAIIVRNRLRDLPIPREQLDVLFDPYRRGRGAEQRSRGLGLGLYIVKEIVRAHHGWITVTSSAEGTEFQVIIPRSSP